MLLCDLCDYVFAYLQVSAFFRVNIVWTLLEAMVSLYVVRFVSLVNRGRPTASISGLVQDRMRGILQARAK